MLILQIAAGIVLGFLVLSYLPNILNIILNIYVDLISFTHGLLKRTLIGLFAFFIFIGLTYGLILILKAVGLPEKVGIVILLPLLWATLKFMNDWLDKLDENFWDEIERKK
tara:strand:+ start:250 stop:582 length:333 start_codon:yes stop_codon:yes gene_type:complete